MAHSEAGFQYVRFHGIFHDDMFVYREDPDGKPVYNYQYIDDLFDRMLAPGVRPFVELGFVPAELASVKTRHSGGTRMAVLQPITHNGPHLCSIQYGIISV